MSQTALTNIGINFNWNIAEDGWKAGVDNNWVLLDALVQPNVFTKGTTAPPGAPVVGDRYIIPASGATGAWSGNAKKVASWNGTVWVMVLPLEGWLVYVLDEHKWYQYNGSNWAVHSMRESSVSGRTLSIASGVVTLDASLGQAFDLQLTANVTTFTITNPAASGDVTRLLVRIRQDGTGGRTLAVPTGTKTPAAAAYTVSSAASAIDEVELTSWDAGTTWYLKANKAFA